MIVFLQCLFCAKSKLLINQNFSSIIPEEGYKKIIICNITEGKTSHTAEIYRGIVQKVIESNMFDVLDLKSLLKIASEQNMVLPDITDQKNLSELYAIIGSAMVVYGTMYIDEYSEKTKREKSYVDAQGARHQQAHREGTYQLVIRFTIIDCESSTTLCQKYVSGICTKEVIADNSQPALINRKELYKVALEQVCDYFYQLVNDLNNQ
jgi:hypothetical protein